jgi:hypothetical protein
MVDIEFFILCVCVCELHVEHKRSYTSPSYRAIESAYWCNNEGLGCNNDFQH